MQDEMDKGSSISTVIATFYDLNDIVDATALIVKTLFETMN